MELLIKDEIPPEKSGGIFLSKIESTVVEKENKC